MSGSASDTSGIDGSSTSSDVYDAGEGAVAGASMGAMLGPYGAAAGAVLGAGLGIYGAIKSGNDQADIDRQKKALEEAQAGEVLKREAENDALAKSAAYRKEADISSQNAAEGHAGGSIGSQLEIKRQTDVQSMLNDQAAQFQASQIMAGAGMEGQLAADTQQAGYLRGAAQGVTLLGRLSQPSQGMVNYSSSPQGLPYIEPGM